MKTRILYISGLGDGYDGFRGTCLKLWQLFGVETRLVASKWYNGASYNSKLDHLNSQIERAYHEDRRVVLVGESAGATLALEAGQSEKVARVITLCGVTSPEISIAASIRRRSPAFVEAVAKLAEVRLSGVTSIRALVDTTVGKKYSIWSDAQQKVVLFVGHLATIIVCLTVLAPWLVWLACNQKS